MKIYAYILVMAVSTYLIRMLPLVLSRKQITNGYIKAFLNYVPVACLTCLTIPSIFHSTEHIISGAVAFGVGLAASLMKKDMVVVAALASAALFICELLVT